MSVLFVKHQSSVSDPPFGGRRGNVCNSSLARWKTRSRLPIGYNYTFSVALTAKTLRAKIRRNRPLLEGVGHFQAKY